MAELFSAPFMESFMEAWNADQELVETLATAGFSATIGYGFDDDRSATGVLSVGKGRVTSAGSYDGQPLELDLRATPEAWQKWLHRRLDPIAVGTALATRQIQNRRGDLTAVTSDPAVSRAFARSLALLASVDDGNFSLPGDDG